MKEVGSRVSYKFMFAHSKPISKEELDSAVAILKDGVCAVEEPVISDDANGLNIVMKSHLHAMVSVARLEAMMSGITFNGLKPLSSVECIATKKLLFNSKDETISRLSLD